MSEILFVVPTSEPKLPEEFCGTLLLATILKNNGMDVDIYRFHEADQSEGFFPFIEQSVSNILAKSPKIVSFYCRCDSYLADIMIAKQIKETNPEIYIVFGGPQADASAYDTLNEIPWVDFCCRGEGETTVYPLFSALLRDRDYKNIEGLSFRDNERNIVENPVPQLIEDLDTLPYIDYSLVPKHIIESGVENDIAVPLDVGRGCPFNCAYCSTSIFWQRKFRIKSADRIVSEMMKLNELYGFNRFVFEHDLFTVSKKHVLEFTNAHNNCGKKFQWACSSRVDTLDEETISAMAQSGLKRVYLGIESGSERMQKLMNKNLKITDVIKTVETFSRHKVNIIASFMYGFPEETPEDLEETFQLVYKLYKLGVQKFQFHLCSINPGTPYYYKYFDKLTLALNQSDQVGDFGFEECQNFIQEHIKLFSFCYEYKSELRDKFANLNECATSTIIIYDTLLKLFPQEYHDTKLTDLLLEIIDIYNHNPNLSSYSELAFEYIKNHYRGDTLIKLTDIFNFHKCCDKANLDDNLEPFVEYFFTDIQAYRNEESFENIKLKKQMLYFFKTDGKVHIKCIPMK